MSGGLSTINTNPQQLQIASDLGVLKKDISLVEQINSSSIGNIPPANNQPNVNQTAAQNLTQQNKASTSVFDSTMMGRLENSLNGVTNSSQRVGDQQSTQMLEEALQSNNTAQHTEQSKSVSQSATDVSATPSTTITKEIASGQHPHLDEETNKAVQAYFNPEQKEVNKEAVNTLINNLRDNKIINEQGKIDFRELGLDKNTIKKAGIEGKIFVNEEGQFDFEIKGKCSEEAQKCMQALKDKLVAITKDPSNELDVKININPASVGPLSHDDQAALANGGQIQYRLLPNGETMKLTLDPGSNGEGDGLTISVYQQDQYSGSQSIKIPLKVVFEGGEFNGNPGVKPLLPNWRDQRLFEGSVIQEKTNLLGKVQETNVDDKGRIQIQNKLWNAVNEYLKISVEVTGGHFDMGNSKTLENQNPEQGATNVSEKTGNESQVTNEKESIEQKESNVPEKNKQQIQTNNDSLESNIQVDIDEKVSTQSNSINYQSEDIQDLNAGGIDANHSVKIENATTISENPQGVIEKKENIQQDAQLKEINNEQTVDNDNEAITEEQKIDQILATIESKIGKDGDLKPKLENIKTIIKAVKKDPQKSKSINDLLTKKLDLLNNLSSFAKNVEDITNGLYDIVGLEKIPDAWDLKIAEFENSLAVDDSNVFDKFHQTYNNFKDALKTFFSKNKDQDGNKTLLTHVYTEDISVLWDETLTTGVEDRIDKVSEDLKSFTDIFKAVTTSDSSQNNQTSISLEFLDIDNSFTQQIIGYKILQDLDAKGIQTTNMKNIDIFQEAKSFKDNKQYEDYNSFLTAFIEHKKQTE